MAETLNNVQADAGSVVPVFTYSIADGCLFGQPHGAWAGLWSGRGDGQNNPAAVARTGHGPLPPGIYRIGTPIKHPRLGPVALPLTQVAGESYGRSAFFIHGASRSNPAESSHGCIIAPRPLREHIASTITALDPQHRILKVVLK